jgi:glutaredoxin-like YruB-family protein
MENHNITVYSTPTCPYCVMAKVYFKKRNLPFRDVDVSKDQSAAKEMIEKSGQMGVPVIEIDGVVTVGFNRDFIEDVISNKIKG